MAPTIPIAPHAMGYTPTSDAVARHQYGVTKTRKTASTGGGRAWTEEEELYLLQTRLQKMPYKHIAAHLKKTELACRLHYHQLSHGSNRRKRTTSVSSGSSTGHSPLMPANAHSPIRDLAPTSSSRSSSPPGSAGSYAPVSPAATLQLSGGGVQLPSIMGNGHGGVSPRLPAILPKPAAMTLPPLSTTSPTRGYPTPLPEPHSASLPSATFPPLTTPPLRLECSVLPPPSARLAHVDMGRLQAVYAAHRASFWSAVAADYGQGIGPGTLEQAWKTGICCAQHQPQNQHQSQHQHQHQPMATTPISPVGTPDHSDRESAGGDRTRISAILGVTEAKPRSLEDQQMVRRMEEERHVGPGA